MSSGHEELPDCSGDEEAWLVEAGDEGLRLDAYLCAHLEDVSRTRAQRWIADGLARVDGASSKSSARLKTGQVVTLLVSPVLQEVKLSPEALPLEIVFEDSDMIVLNKAVGMVVHPSPGHATGTMVHALLHHCRGQLSGIGGVARPGIVHRLDKDTSGLIMAAKTDLAHASLSDQIAKKEASRLYWAVVGGHLPTSVGRVDAPLARHVVHRQRMAVVAGGRPAATRWEVLESFRGYEWVACLLETGRTHQIRVHMNYLGHPIVGDPVYGGDRSLPVKLSGQALHARGLRVRHPRTAEILEFEASPPEPFSKLLNYLRLHRAEKGR
ncbi:MAG: RluA family pseudouridine synthase [Candidatus Sericytochromatia bacterium]|nr:RluA family pseudouridine synthase [Candidatus Sericytochromatia bacterium]